MTTRATALIGIGSSLGDRLAALSTAKDRLAALPSARLVACSSVYETTAVGAPGPNFYNAVAVVETTVPAAELLQALHGIEAAMGRVRRERWGPRVIDLDLLAWIAEGEHTSIVETGALELPHPRMTQRDFVLAPLQEVWPQLEVGGLRVAELLARLPDADRSVIATLGAVP